MTFPKWPSWRFGPNGQSAVFESEGDVPKGWEDHPTKVKGAEPAAEGVKTARAPANSTTTASEAAKSTEAKSQTMTDPAKAATSGTAGLVAETPQPAPQAPAKSEELDVDGNAFDPELHASTKSKTKAGKWRMKVGVSRPDPAQPFNL